MSLTFVDACFGGCGRGAGRGDCVGQLGEDDVGGCEGELVELVGEVRGIDEGAGGRGVGGGCRDDSGGRA